MNPLVDKYLLDGCMRCKYGGTLQCKVHKWQTELDTLRHIVLECGLQEELKWGMPCYTYNSKNIVMIAAFKHNVTLSFFKGSLMQDTYSILSNPGENSQSNRFLKFTNTEQIIEKYEIIKLYIAEAVQIEISGKKVQFNKVAEKIPDELIQMFNSDANFKNAFYRLTPGRQRGYILYFSQPKQSQTKISRIEKYKSNILNGKGLQD